MSTRHVPITLLALLLLCGLVTPNHAQDVRATLAGQVSDPSGAAVPGARIIATNVERNTTHEAVSNEAGRYIIGFLLPGNYSLVVEATGFKKFVRENIVLSVASKVGVDVQLQVGSVNESVTVTAESPLLESETASRGQLVTSHEIANLPNNGRNVWQLVWAAPGVIKASTYWGSMENYALGNASNAVINGGKQKENETLMDGTTDTLANRDVNLQPPLESVQEMKVHTNTYDAAFGRTGGGVITITTKAGTNGFHGALYEFNKTDALGANPWVLNFFAQPKPHFINNTFGFEVDGPIYIPKILDGRNKLFFMVSYEGLRERSSGGDSALVPTDAMRRGDLSGVPVTVYDPLTTRTVGGQLVRDAFPRNDLSRRISPVAPKVLEFVPQPNFQGGAGEDNYAAFLGAKNGYNEFLTRLDYRVNAKNNIYIRHGRLPYQEFDDILFGGSSPAEPSTENPLHRNFYNWSADWTSTLSPRSVLNLRAGLARYVNTGGNPHAAAFDPRQLGFAEALVGQFRFLHYPRFDLGRYTPIGSTSVVNKTVNDAYTYQANLNHQRGRHQLKGGAEFRIYNQNRITPGLSSGRYTFNKSFTQRDPLRADATSGDEFASFLLGYPAGGSVDLNIDPAYKHRYWALFFQDDWKVTSRLSLNFGLRWDYEQPTYERYNRMIRGFAFDAPAAIANQVSGLTLKGGLLYAGSDGEQRLSFVPDHNNFQPRVGVAYRLTDRWVLRGGYGLSYLGAHDSQPNNGFSSPTTLIASNDGGLTPRANLVNAYPEGLLQPQGSSQGLASFLGLGLNFGYLNRPLPYSHQFSFGFQREMRGGWLVEASYSGNESRRLPVAANVNVLPVSELGKPDAYYTERLPNPMRNLIPLNSAKNGATIPRQDLLLPYPHFGGLTVTNIPIGRVHYHSMQTKVQKRYSHGMTLLVAYTIGKNLEEVNFLNNQDFNRADPDSSRLEKRLTQFDAPQKLASIVTYELPFGRNKRFGASAGPVANKLISGWQINSQLTFQSGFPADHPNAPELEARSAKLPAEKINLYNAWDKTLYPLRPPNLTFNLRTFPTRFPDVRLYPLKNVDFSLAKHTALTERVTFEFRAEFLNGFNHPWFSRLDGNATDVTRATFGWYRRQEGNQMRLIALVGKLVW